MQKVMCDLTHLHVCPLEVIEQRKHKTSTCTRMVFNCSASIKQALAHMVFNCTCTHGVLTFLLKQMFFKQTQT